MRGVRRESGLLGELIEGVARGSDRPNRNPISSINASNRDTRPARSTRRWSSPPRLVSACRDTRQLPLQY